MEDLQTELQLCLSDSKIMSRYTEKEVTDTLLEYYNNKEVDSKLKGEQQESDFRKDLQSYITEIKSLTPPQRQTYYRLLCKKHAYLKHSLTYEN